MFYPQFVSLKCLNCCIFKIVLSFMEKLYWLTYRLSSASHQVHTRVHTLTSGPRRQRRYLFNVDVLFCTRLKQVDSHLLGELLRVSRLDHLGVGVVVLVSHWGAAKVRYCVWGGETKPGGVRTESSPNIRHTSSQFWLISCNHRLTLTKDSALVTSYTTMTPCVPL